MTTSLRRSIRWAETRSLPAAVAASALAVAVLIGGPVVLGQRPTHRFLLWNLALAWVPYVAAIVVEELDDRGRRHVAGALAAGAVWLLFLPNAPYLISDLSHFDRGSTTPWLDLARLVSFAWAGCLLAVLSLRAVHRVLLRHAGRVTAGTAVVVAAFGSGFGVVLGRFARLNSWQAVTAPRTVVDELARVGNSGRDVAIALFFGFLLLTIYAATAPTDERLVKRS